MAAEEETVNGSSSSSISPELNQRWLKGFIDSFLNNNMSAIQDIYTRSYSQSGEEGAIFIKLDDGTDRYVPKEELLMEVTTDMKIEVTFMALSQIRNTMPKLADDLQKRMATLEDEKRMLTIIPYNRFGNIVLSQIYAKAVSQTDEKII